MDWKIITLLLMSVLMITTVLAQIQVGGGNQRGVILDPMTIDTRTNLTHGEMYIFNESLQTVVIPTQNVFVNITNWTGGSFSRVSFVDGHTFKILESGTYFMDFSVSFGSDAAVAGEFGFNIMVSGEGQNNTHSQRDTSQTSIGNTGASAILQLRRGDLVYLTVRDESFPTNDINIHNAQLQIIKIDLITGGAGGGNITEADVVDLIVANAWLLTGTNAPPSAVWEMGGFGFLNIGNSNMSGDLRFPDDEILFFGSNNLLDGRMLWDTPANILQITSDNSFIIDAVDTLTLSSDNQTYIFGSSLVHNWETLKFRTMASSGEWTWNGTTDTFEYQDNIKILRGKELNATGDIKADGIFIGNGSGLHSLNVEASGGFDENGNFTLNGSWDFITNVTLRSNVSLRDNVNLSWRSGESGCLKWEAIPSSSEAVICGKANVIDITAVNVNFPKSQKLTVGRSTETEPVGLNVITAGLDDFFFIDDSWNGWQLSNYLGWDDLTGTRVGLVLATAFASMRNNNFTWKATGCLGGNCEVKMNSRGDFIFDLQRSINTTNDFCLMDGTCLSTVGGEGGSVKTRTRGNTTAFDSTSYNPDGFLDFPVVAGRNYTFEFNIFYSGSSPTGDFFVNVSSPTRTIIWEEFFLTTHSVLTDSSAEGSQIQPDASTRMYKIVGSVFPTVTGTLGVEYRSSSGVTAVSMKQGSNAVLREVTL